jgi:hypothetical protein
MNYLYDIGYTQARHQLSHDRNLRLRQQSSTSRDELLTNNQYILEFNYFRAYATSLLHEINDTYSQSASRRHTRRSLNFTNQFNNRSGARVMRLNERQSANIDASGIPHTSLEEFMQLDYIISDILMRDYDIDMSIGVMHGLNETEVVNGLIDTSYNSAIHIGVNTSCPISLDDFKENDSVKQIIKCGHIYKSPPLIKWFKQHTRCPLCRYDLRIGGQQRDICFNGRGIDEIEREIDTIVNSIASVRTGIDVAYHNNNNNEDYDSWSSDSE